MDWCRTPCSYRPTTSYKLQHTGCIIHGWVNELWAKNYHIDDVREPRGVILCVGRRVPFISNAYSWYLMHDTCGQRYLTVCCVNKPQKKSVLTARIAAKLSLRLVGIFSDERFKRKEKKWIFLQSTMYSLMNSTQISSLLCRWRLAVSEVWNKTNISWDRKPLMMKCSSHRNNWMQKDTVNYDMVENTLDNERGRLAESHLAPIHVNRQMRTHKRNNTYSIYTSVYGVHAKHVLSHASNINLSNGVSKISDPISRHKYCSPHSKSEF